MYYECFMRAFLIVGIFCAVLLALVGEFILSFLCVLISVYMRFIVSLRWKGKGMKNERRRNVANLVAIKRRSGL